VGTHLDKVPASRKDEMKARHQEKIKELYGGSGFPAIEDIIEVSAVTKEGESSHPLFSVICLLH